MNLLKLQNYVLSKSIEEHPVDIIKKIFDNPPLQPSFNYSHLEIKWKIIDNRYDFYIYNSTLTAYSEFFECSHEDIVYMFFTKGKLIDKISEIIDKNWIYTKNNRYYNKKTFNDEFEKYRRNFN